VRRGGGDCDRQRARAGADVGDAGRAVVNQAERCVDELFARSAWCHHLTRRGHEWESVEARLIHTRFVSRARRVLPPEVG